MSGRRDEKEQEHWLSSLEGENRWKDLWGKGKVLLQVVQDQVA
jgi:hypothetical protein